MPRIKLQLAVLLLGLMIPGIPGAAATPPKNPGPGTATPGGQASGEKESRDQVASRGALPAKEWFELVSLIDVSVVQQNELTPVIRTYLAELDRWQKVGSVKMRALLEKARSSDETERKVLVKQARELRKSMPRYDLVKEEVWELLTPFQRTRLFEMTQERKSRGLQLAKNPVKKRERAEDDAERSRKGDVKVEPGKAKLWSFRNDQDPERHADSGKDGDSRGDASATKKDPAGS